jgi:hypothetical protein
MVEIRVAVPDATRVPGLMRRLAGLFDRSSVSFDGVQRRTASDRLRQQISLLTGEEPTKGG